MTTPTHMTTQTQLRTALQSAAIQLRDEVASLTFGDPVTHVYNPLDYAWTLHRQYLAFARPTCRVLFLGMNPGPWGMAQTGVPFGQVSAVADWLKIRGDLPAVSPCHPKRPIEGLRCGRSEVSGERLWGLMREEFGTPAKFFAKHFVVNHCPLVFMESSGRNRTPDKLPASEWTPLREICDRHLATVLGLLPWDHLIGVGAYAEKRLQAVIEQMPAGLPSHARIGRILHPSPASPAANRDWSGQVRRQLHEAGVWTDPRSAL